MDKRPELVVFSENKLGGVQSFYYNLLNHDPYDDFRKKWIFTDNFHPEYAKLIKPYDLCEEIVFEYGTDPILKSARLLSKLISPSPGIVVVNQELELVTLHRFPKKEKTIIFVCHDENYLPFAEKYEFMIDAFIAHNPFFAQELKRILPPARTGDVYFLPFGVEISPLVRTPDQGGPLRLIFIARLHEKKGVYDLSKIEDGLQSRGIFVEWTIVGDGPEKSQLMSTFGRRSNVQFFTPETTAEVLTLAVKNDVYILPSYLDGMPVAMLEAMSSGLVPIVTRFNPGIDQMVTNDIGEVVPVGGIDEFVNAIEVLNSDRILLEEKSKLAREKIVTRFDARAKACAYFELFRRFKELKKPIRSKHIQYDGRLDYPFIPPFIRNSLRFIRKLIR